MKRFIGDKAAAYLPALVLLLAVWELLTLMYPPLVVPGIAAVCGKLGDILADGKSLHTLWLTAERLLAGLGIGVAAGSALGLLFGYHPRVHRACQPLLGLVQAVPPVSWLVLALLWFGFNGRPSVFIVALSALPILTVNLTEGVAGVDPKLLEMGRIYGFSRRKRLRSIVWPSILPHFRSALRIAAGNGCKAVVMGEVLTTGNGVGGAITDARLNLEPETVIAWTILMVALYYLLDHLAIRLLAGRKGRPC